VIVVRGNRIESVSDSGKAAIPPGAVVLDLSHATVLPDQVVQHEHDC
jgi:imidazolonepropionase-like amidohydrolase